MALNFTYNKYKDIHTIKNDGIVKLTYTLTRKECGSSTEVLTKDIEVDETITIPFKYIDGVYSIFITDGIEEQILDDILYYNNLLLTIIKNVEASLCGCKPCDECEDCNDCDIYLNTLNQVLAYGIVNNPNYKTNIDLITETMKCDFSQTVLCMLTNSMINGDEDSKKIYLKFIAIYYLAFYNFDVLQSVDNEETNYIKEKYNYSKIIKCISKLGINVDEISEMFLQNIIIHYWQFPDLSYNSSYAPFINQVFLDAQNTLPIDIFMNGNSFVYGGVARIGFALSNIGEDTFEIHDTFGQNITNIVFDSYWNESLKTQIYISKEHITPSTIYYKLVKK